MGEIFFSNASTKKDKKRQTRTEEFCLASCRAFRDCSAWRSRSRMRSSPPLRNRPRLPPLRARRPSSSTSKRRASTAPRWTKRRYATRSLRSTAAGKRFRTRANFTPKQSWSPPRAVRGRRSWKGAGAVDFCGITVYALRDFPARARAERIGVLKIRACAARVQSTGETANRGCTATPLANARSSGALIAGQKKRKSAMRKGVRTRIAPIAYRSRLPSPCSTRRCVTWPSPPPTAKSS